MSNFKVSVKNKGNRVSRNLLEMKNSKEYLLNLPQIEDPTTYFQDTTINQSLFPRVDSNRKLVPYSFVGPSSIFLENQFGRGFFKTGTKILSNSQIRRKDINERIKQTCIVNNTEVENLYENAFSRIEKSDVNEFMNNIPKDLQRSLRKQEKNLVCNNDFIEKSKKLIEKICVISKKNKDDSLVNQSSYFRKKNEVKNISEEKFQKNNLNKNQNQWILDLRNYSKEIKSLTESSKEKNINEIVSKPDDKFLLPKIKTKIKKNRLFECAEQIDFPCFYDLNFKGTKIIEEEFNEVKNRKGKKVIHRQNNELFDEKEEYENYSKGKFNSGIKN